VVEARTIPADAPEALALVDAMVGEIVAHYGDGLLDRTPSATPDDLSPPGGCYVALFDGDRAVAGGGVKRLADGVGEIKRMYVVPDRRGEGLGRVLLRALEDAARGLGYATVRLDTGRAQGEALRLYRSAGYVDIPDYNGNAYASYWGEKRL
jgi:GNAT superfamily N-acetyltransferase